MEAQHILRVALVGTGATLLTDLWNLFLRRAFGIRSLNFCLLGRWIRHMPRGTFRHANIAAAEPLSRECAVGWIAHYSIGIALTLMFVLMASGEWLLRPTFLPALVFGVATVVFPFFVLQPSLGLGFASSRTPSPKQARLKSLMTHTVFGIGMWGCAFALRYLLQARS